jgi:hypothetical protein
MLLGDGRPSVRSGRALGGIYAVKAPTMRGRASMRRSLPPRAGRALLAVLFALSLTACPARRPAATDDPGPPTVLDPGLLDRA